MTTNHTSVETLGDYLDGTLTDAPARADVAAHVAACPPCAARLVTLARLNAAAAAAPRAVEPPEDLWPSIRAAIGDRRPAPATSHASAGGVSAGRSPDWRRVGTLAAAALLVAALSSVATWRIAHWRDGASVVAGRPVTSPPPSTVADGGGVAGRAALLRYVALERGYDRTAAELRAALDAQRGTLAPATVATVERSLRTIDDAIAEARAALARDPGNQALLEMLTTTHEQRLDLLRRATSLQSGA